MFLVSPAFSSVSKSCGGKLFLVCCSVSLHTGHIATQEQHAYDSFPALFLAATYFHTVNVTCRHRHRLACKNTHTHTHTERQRDTHTRTHTHTDRGTHRQTDRHRHNQTHGKCPDSGVRTMSCTCWLAETLETALATFGTLASTAPDPTPMSCMSAVTAFMSHQFSHCLQGLAVLFSIQGVYNSLQSIGQLKLLHC